MDIENKVFSVEKRGYSIAEVDNYVKQIAIEVKKQSELMAEISEKNEELVTLNEEYKNREAAIKDVLLAAHKTAETMMADAKKQATLIEAQAKLEYNRAYEEVEALKKGFAAYQQRLLDYVENQKKWLLGYSDSAPEKSAASNETEADDKEEAV